MQDFSLPILLNLILFLSFPFVFGLLFSKLKLPSMLSFIVAGIFLGLFLKDRVGAYFLAQFANIGIVLLLFTVGLEVNFQQIARLGKFVLLGGILQIIFSSLLIFILSLIFKIGLAPSLLLSFAFSFSSTAVVVKIIQERGEEGSFLGEITIGILLFQDLAAIPLLIILSSVSQNANLILFLKEILFTLLKIIFVFIIIYFLGRKSVPFIFDKLAKTTRELLNLFTVLFIAIVVFIFSALHLPSAVAAFVSGILIGQTLQHYHIFSQIRPFRDLFAILFFVFLGVNVNLPAVIFKLPQILLFALLVILIKFLVVLLIFVVFRLHTRISFSAGILLSNVGEFAFIILHQGYNNKVIPYEVYLFALTTVLLTIIASPVLISSKDKIYHFLKKRLKKYIPALNNFVSALDRDLFHASSLDLQNHVVVCGFGRFGEYIGKAFNMADIPFVAIDYNYHIVEKAKKQGINIIYGDPTDIDILNYANTGQALVLISTLPEKFSQEAVILNTKKLNSRATILTRVNNLNNAGRLKDLGAHVIIQPEFEAALSIIRKIFLSFNLPQDEIIAKIKRLKLGHGVG